MSAFAEALRRHAHATPAKTAAVDDTTRLSYAELDALVDRVAADLRAAGVGPGDVVPSQLPNGVPALAQCVAANRLDAVHAPLLPTWREHERSSVLGAERRPPARRSAPRTRQARFLLYTSGSTAAPKGVLHSDGTLVAECEAQAAYHGLTSDEVFVMPSPVAHVSGLLYGELLPIWLGATTVLMPAWDAGRFLELVERERGTFCGGATPFLQGAADHPDLHRFETGSLRVFPCGGADVPPDLIRRAARRLGVRTGRGYGSTEFPSITSGAGPGDPDDKRAETDGRPIGANQVRIAGDGEIEARGPELFLGYTDPALDDDAFTDDGWFRTGDLGVVDDDGWLTVTGRKKDIVIRLGEKISAAEVEGLLREHPRVADVAVIALPDSRTGERVCAVVVPTGDPPALHDLTCFLSTRGLSHRKLPEQLEVVRSLPLGPSGKVDKQLLRQRFER